MIAKMISVPFEYRGKQYYSLVRFRDQNDYTEIRVTIMNGELERTLYGNHVLQFKNGYLIVDVPHDSSRQAELKLALIRGLDAYFAKHKNRSFIGMESMQLS